MSTNEIESAQALAAELGLDCTVRACEIEMATGEVEPAETIEDAAQIIRQYAR